MKANTLSSANMLVSRNPITFHRLFSYHFRSLTAFSTQRIAQDDTVTRGNKLFDEEMRRQQSLIARIEKIRVTVKDVKPETEDVILLMNKDQSTPFDCAQHISELYTTRSALATVKTGNRDSLWDMHRPLSEECSVKFHHFMDSDSRILNQVFWRSCSFTLGMVIKTALKDESGAVLHSWPPPNIQSGSFVYDVSIPTLEGWNPTRGELLTLTSVLWKIKERKHNFERLCVSRDLAKEILSPNQFKSNQIDGMPGSTKSVTLYRVGDHIDMSGGPMIANVGQIGRASVTAVYKIDSEDGPLFRFQGVAIPQELRINHFAFKILLERSTKMNKTHYMK